MKKILLLVFPLLLSITSQAQSFIPDSQSSDTVAMLYTPGAPLPFEVHNNMSSTSATPVTLKWKVIAAKFDAGWDPVATGVCDNFNCRSNVNTLLSNTASEYSDPYTTRGVFDVQFAVSGPGPAAGTRASVTVRFTDTVTSYSRTLTFIAYRAALGIGQTYANDNSVSLYPNPARESVNVIFDKQADVKTIAIYNMIGKTMRVFKPSDNNSAKLDLDAIPSGVYFVRLMNSDGQVVATRRFTRQ